MYKHMRKQAGLHTKLFHRLSFASTIEICATKRRRARRGLLHMDQSNLRELHNFSWDQRGELEQQRSALIEPFLEKLAPLPLHPVPQPWETLASLLSRTARKMGYESPQWLLHSEQIPSHTIDPAFVPCLERHTDYRYFSRLLLLEEEQLYELTLHRFAKHLARPFSADPTQSQHPAIRRTDTRSFLSHKQRTQFFDSTKYVRVCPYCLDEGKAYDRLYWQCELMLSCPRHNVFLIDRCPACQDPIPALRLLPTTCPFCPSGDYRSALLSVPSEEHWLIESQVTLLEQLGVDGSEMGECHTANNATAFQSSPSWEYFQLLSLGSSTFEQCFSGIEIAMSFLVRNLGLSDTVERLGHNLQKISPKLLRRYILMDYLLSSWPMHFLVFLERLQRFLQEEYHYSSESPIVLKWNKSMLQGRYWCVSEYQERPIPQLHTFFNDLMACFARLPLAEKAESSTQEVSIVSTEQEKVSVDEVGAPYPWESLTSFLMRIAGKKKHVRLEWLLSSVGVSDVFRLIREDLLLLRRQEDYDVFEQHFTLSRHVLHTLTLHRFAPVLQPPGSTEHLLLSKQSVSRYCMPRGTTKVCPVCLDAEPEAYERLYWNLRSVLVCPRHLVFLVDRCPNCTRLIPTQTRSNITECPYCHRGDYRAAVPETLTQDSLLYQSQQILLHFLGVEEMTSRKVSRLFSESPLPDLPSWQYFDLLDHFRLIAPHLRPERALSIFCRTMGFPKEPAAYQQRGEKQKAVLMSLFHALFVSWPGQAFNILGAGSKIPGWEHSDEGAYLYLKYVFEEQRKYAQQAMWRRQAQQASVLLTTDHAIQT